MNKTQSAIFTGLIFATVYFFVALEFMGPFSAALTAIIPGLFFGATPHFWEHSKLAQRRKKRIIGEKEVLFSGTALYDKGRFGNEGILYLTSEQLIFKSDLVNFRHYHLKINMSDLDEIENYDDDSLMPTGIYLRLNNGETFYFAFYNRDEWMQKIRKIRLGFV